MKYDDRLAVEHKLQGIPDGHLRIVQKTASDTAVLPAELLLTRIQGKGSLDLYHIQPGMDASYTTFLASEVIVQHAALPNILELFYCRRGRVGWNMEGNTAIYLGAGDLSVHSIACCAHSAMMFPLGYAEGISISLDLGQLAVHCPPALAQADLDFAKIQEAFCGPHPLAIPSCAELEQIFAPLYGAEPAMRLPYLQLKVQELLLYLSRAPRDKNQITQYFSQQTELIKEIHAFLISHLSERFTIEDLSKRYAVNTSTLKAVFKTVYGLPIAAYMKEYRVRESMKLLRETGYTIAQISEQVGYESQGKFTKAFKDVAQILPTEYRKNHTSK